MEAHFETLVGSYLTRFGSVFISPQFDIAWGKEAEQGGACPDFVALDFDQKCVVVVEVTTAYNLLPLYEKIRNRDRHWYPPLRRHLSRIGAIPDEWPSRFLGFVRECRVQVSNELFSTTSDVKFYPIEKALLEYAYFVERKKGLP